jgi:hypothetical protein
LKKMQSASSTPVPPHSSWLNQACIKDSSSGSTSRTHICWHLDKFDLIIVVEVEPKEANHSEFFSDCARLCLLYDIADGIAYDIPDPVSCDIHPNEIGRELSMLIAKGNDKIILQANSLCYRC